MKFFLITSITLLLSGCNTIGSAIPDNYNGPRAYIYDSQDNLRSSKVNIYSVTQVNEQRISSSFDSTSAASYGRGFSVQPSVIGREIPAKESTFTLMGSTYHAAPILAIIGTTYSVSGEVTFMPEVNKKYIVKGTLGKEYSAIWIEEQKTGKRVTDKIESVNQ